VKAGGWGGGVVILLKNTYKGDLINCSGLGSVARLTSVKVGFASELLTN